VARDAVATRRGFGSPQATSQKREVAHPAHGPQATDRAHRSETAIRVFIGSRVSRSYLSLSHPLPSAIACWMVNQRRRTPVVEHDPPRIPHNSLTAYPLLGTDVAAGTIPFLLHFAWFPCGYPGELSRNWRKSANSCCLSGVVRMRIRTTCGYPDPEPLYRRVVRRYPSSCSDRSHVRPSDLSRDYDAARLRERP